MVAIIFGVRRKRWLDDTCELDDVGTLSALETGPNTVPTERVPTVGLQAQITNSFICMKFIGVYLRWDYLVKQSTES